MNNQIISQNNHIATPLQEQNKSSTTAVSISNKMTDDASCTTKATATDKSQSIHGNKYMKRIRRRISIARRRMQDFRFVIEY
ncbi:unnamed protein product [Pseudo-nitzschia multistriata]|uniref:Uncharacterized protein n=1 Tax=Pseudo-nitzschia multistriata TaxID=183589 RepID=A0A448ZQY9_9STRA|nr:unnamed protein product [Pseudo-nitzschia multistriata]